MEKIAEGQQVHPVTRLVSGTASPPSDPPCESSEEMAIKVKMLCNVTRSEFVSRAALCSCSATCNQLLDYDTCSGNPYILLPL